MSGISEVARRAGVSKSTASRALSGRGYVAPATQQRVQAVAEELGYVPSTSAVSLATGKTQTIGVIVPDTARWFFGEVIEGIQRALMDHGLDLALYSALPGSAERAHVFETYLGRNRFDGLISVGIEPDEQELERIASLGKPFVSIGSYDVGNSAVSIDDAAAARIATEHLLSLGHEHIVFLGGRLDDPSRPSYGDHQRVTGYQQTMSTAGLAAYAQHVPCSVAMPEGYAAAVDLLSDPRTRPTAIVAVADEVAIGAIIAARRMGIAVPTQLSVVGIDDHDLAEMFSLTTLRQDPRAQGAAAVALLLAHMADPLLAAHREWAPVRFVVRNTTVRPGAAAPA